MTPSKLIKQLQLLPQDKSIVCQVVGQESGAWNMGFEFNDIPDSWMIQLRVEHPRLEKLSMNEGWEDNGK